MAEHKPTRYRVANNQAQLTLGGGVLVVDENGLLINYAHYLDLKEEHEDLKRHFFEYLEHNQLYADYALWSEWKRQQ